MRASPAEVLESLYQPVCGGSEGKELEDLMNVLTRGCCSSLHPAPDAWVSLVNLSLHFK